MPEAKTGIDGMVSSRTRVGERAGRRQRGLRAAAAAVVQQMLGCRHISIPVNEDMAL